MSMCFLLFCLIIRLYLGKILNNCNDYIYPESFDTVLCGNYCRNCFIVVNKTQQNLNIYSSALHTKIKCIGIQSCIQSNIFIGNIESMDKALYTRELYNTAIIDCHGINSCNFLNININGVINNGAYVFAGKGQNNLINSNIDVNIVNKELFNIYCGHSNQNNCVNTKYNCYNGLCFCNDQYSGKHGSCSNIEFGSTSRNPTKNTLIPTYSPTILPINIEPNDTNTPTIFDIPTNNSGSTIDLPRLLAVMVFVLIIICILCLSLWIFIGVRWCYTKTLHKAGINNIPKPKETQGIPKRVIITNEQNGVYIPKIADMNTHNNDIEPEITNNNNTNKAGELSEIDSSVTSYNVSKITSFRDLRGISESKEMELKGDDYLHIINRKRTHVSFTVYNGSHKNSINSRESTPSISYLSETIKNDNNSILKSDSNSKSEGDTNKNELLSVTKWNDKKEIKSLQNNLSK